jgi:hypothetical protein
MDYRKYIKKEKKHPIYGEEPKESAAAFSPPAADPSRLKKFLGVRFECCGVYTRAYQNRQGTAYIARCPRCAQQVTIGIDAQKGTDARFFVVR